MTNLDEIKKIRNGVKKAKKITDAFTENYAKNRVFSTAVQEIHAQLLEKQQRI